MEEVYPIYDAKAHLSRLLKRVKAGHEVIISERGTPIVRMVPYEKTGSFADRISRWGERGVIIAKKRKGLPKGTRRSGALKRFLQERE